MVNVKDYLQMVVKNYYQGLKGATALDFKVIGMGNFSVVFSMGDAVYKISTEQSFIDASVSIANINKLADSGVNVPKTYTITTSTENPKCVRELQEIVRKSTSFNNFINLLQDFLKKYDVSDTNNIQVCSIMQQRIGGNRIFYSRERFYDRLDLIKKEILQQAIKYKDNPPQQYKITLEIISQAQKVAEENLDRFVKIPVDKYAKFIYDGLVLAKNNIMVDNINKSNFKYVKGKGFYFIDLDGLSSDNNQRFAQQNASAKNPFNYTIGNVYSQVDIDPTLYTPSMSLKALHLSAKISNALCSVYLDNLDDEYIVNQIKGYVADIKTNPNNPLNIAYTHFPSNIDQTTANKYLSRFANEMGIISGNIISMQKD